MSQELHERGVSVVLATPRPSKRGLTAFSTPAGRAQDTPKQARAQGRVFGRRLAELTTRAVALADNQQMDVLVPSFLVSACEYIERSVEVEGVYRMSGSQQRQRVGHHLMAWDNFSKKIQDLFELKPFQNFYVDIFLHFLQLFTTSGCCRRFFRFGTFYKNLASCHNHSREVGAGVPQIYLSV